MADHAAPDVLARLTTLETRLAAQEATIHQQGTELAHYRRRRRYGRATRRTLPLLLAALLVALVPLATLAANPFTDLTGGPHDGNIDAIYNAGITTGCDPGVAYCPTANVTREEMASFLARTAGLGGNPPITNALTAQSATSAGNANTVGGYAPSGLARVAHGFGYIDELGLGLTTSYQTLASVTITVPGPGFILVNGTVTTFGINAAASTNTRLRDTAAGGTASPVSWTTVGSGIGAAYTMPVSPTWVFPAATAGTKTFVIECREFRDNASSAAHNASLTALYVPFGPDGGTP